MALNVGTLYQELILDDRKWKSGLSAVSREAQNAGSTAGRSFGTSFDKGVDSGTDAAKRSINDVEHHAVKTSKRMGTAMKAAIGVGIAAIGAGLYTVGRQGFQFAKESLNLASEWQQNVGGLKAVYGANAAEMRKWAKEQATFGLAQNEAASMAAKMGANLKSTGINAREAAKETRKLASISYDAAATFGGKPQEAAEAVLSALKGNFEMTDRFGMTLTADIVKAEAVASGIAKTSVDPALVAVKQAALIRAKERVAEIQHGKQATAGEIAQAKAAKDAAAASLTKARADVAAGKADQTLVQTKQAALLRARERYNEVLNGEQATRGEIAQAIATQQKAEADLKKVMEGKVEALTAEQKARATIAVIEKQTRDSRGQALREQNTYEAQLNKFIAQWKNVKTVAGKALLPIATDLLKDLNDQVPAIKRFLKRNIPFIKEQLRNLKQWFKDNKDELKDAFDTILDVAKTAGKAIWDVVKAFHSLPDSVQKLFVTVGVAGVLLSRFSGPVKLAGGLVKGLSKLFKKGGKSASGFGDDLLNMGTKAGTASSGIATLIETLTGVSVGVAGGVLAAVAAAAGVVALLYKQLDEVWNVSTAKGTKKWMDYQKQQNAWKGGSDRSMGLGHTNTSSKITVPNPSAKGRFREMQTPIRKSVKSTPSKWEQWAGSGIDWSGGAMGEVGLGGGANVGRRHSRAGTASVGNGHNINVYGDVKVQATNPDQLERGMRRQVRKKALKGA